jgi:hypothetical protein
MRAAETARRLATGLPPSADPRGCARRLVGFGRDGTRCRPETVQALERRVLMAVDFGDAPASYGTLLAGDGARHTVVDGLRLGQRLDGEADGQPTAAADGDDLNPPNPGGTGDDEDGVFFFEFGAFDPGPVIGKGAATRMTVTPTAPGVIDAFVDYNRDGDFTDPGEKVVDSVAVAGTHTFFVRAPANAAAGDSYVRVRFSSAGGLGPTGPAEDGEVEDHRVRIADLDWGDAPDSYGTLSISNGPASVVGSLFLGQRVDVEFDGRPDDAALADDTNPAGAPDDEDGVVIPRLVQGRQAVFQATLSQPGYVIGYIDVNGNGDFDIGQFQTEVIPFYPGRVGSWLPAGPNNAFYFIPTTARAGVSYARFRVDAVVDSLNTSNLWNNRGFFGSTGEVEDYRVVIEQGFDWGDAPATYGTTGAGGARHALGTPLALGFSYNPLDSEDDGQPTLAADGDDNAPSAGFGEEAGVEIGRLDRGASSTVKVYSAAAGGRLDAFFDFNRDGDFTDPGEKVVSNGALPVVAGIQGNQFTFNVPASAPLGPTYARFRVSSAGGLGPAGEAADGEVEDYRVNIVEGGDFGDLPAPYPTLLADNGARHRVGGILYLGNSVDAEVDGQPGAAATGDDLLDADDEDGVSLANLVRGGSASANVFARGTGGILDAFVDFNGDGDFADAGEKIFNSRPVSNGINNLNFNVPVGAKLGTVYARFRVSTAGGLSATGEAPDGEVEDYAVQVRSTAPVLTLPGPSAAFTPGGAGVVIDPTATVTDPDTTTFDLGRLTVELINNTAEDDDGLTVRNQGGGAGQVGFSGNTVTYGGVHVGTASAGGAALAIVFNANATLAAVQAVVRNIVFNSDDSPTSGLAPRTVRFVLEDGAGGTSNPRHRDDPRRRARRAAGGGGVAGLLGLVAGVPLAPAQQRPGPRQLGLRRPRRRGPARRDPLGQRRPHHGALHGGRRRRRRRPVRPRRERRQPPAARLLLRPRQPAGVLVAPRADRRRGQSPARPRRRRGRRRRQRRVRLRGHAPEPTRRELDQRRRHVPQRRRRRRRRLPLPNQHHARRRQR